MSETVKLIIELPKEIYESRYGDECDEKDCLIIDTFTNAIANGIPLDDVKAEIEQIRSHSARFRRSDGSVAYADTDNILDVLDNIGKGVSE